MKYMCPLIVVSDIKKSRELYETTLKQTVKFDYGENVTFVGDFAIHEQDHFKTLINNKDIIKKSNSMELVFEHNDLESIVNKLKELGIEFIHEIVEQPWKQWVIRFYDYDKNIIEIGEEMEHVAYRLSKENYTLQEIASITYISVEAVKEAIKKYSPQDA